MSKQLALDWNDFVHEVSNRVKSGWSRDMLADGLSGKRVEWQGVVDEMDLDDPDAPGISVRMPEQKVELPNGARIPIDGLDLPIDESAVDDWKRVRIGSTVIFSAMLSASPFPAIDVVPVSDTRSVLMVRLTDAVLVDAEA